MIECVGGVGLVTGAGTEAGLEGVKARDGRRWIRRARGTRGIFIWTRCLCLAATR